MLPFLLRLLLFCGVPAGALTQTNVNVAPSGDVTALVHRETSDVNEQLSEESSTTNSKTGNFHAERGGPVTGLSHSADGALVHAEAEELHRSTVVGRVTPETVQGQPSSLSQTQNLVQSQSSTAQDGAIHHDRPSSVLQMPVDRSEMPARHSSVSKRRRRREMMRREKGQHRGTGMYFLLEK